jgi:hypothetical protein
MEAKKFNISVDDSCIDILDWISSNFHNGNWHKNFEATISLREIDYNENGEQFYVDEVMDNNAI